MEAPKKNSPLGSVAKWFGRNKSTKQENSGSPDIDIYNDGDYARLIKQSEDLKTAAPLFKKMSLREEPAQSPRATITATIPPPHRDAQIGEKEPQLISTTPTTPPKRGKGTPPRSEASPKQKTQIASPELHSPRRSHKTPEKIDSQADQAAAEGALSEALKLSRKRNQELAASLKASEDPAKRYVPNGNRSARRTQQSTTTSPIRNAPIAKSFEQMIRNANRQALMLAQNDQQAFTASDCNDLRAINALLDQTHNLTPFINQMLLCIKESNESFENKFAFLTVLSTKHLLRFYIAMSASKMSYGLDKPLSKLSGSVSNKGLCSLQSKILEQLAKRIKEASFSVNDIELCLPPPVESSSWFNFSNLLSRPSISLSASSSSERWKQMDQICSALGSLTLLFEDIASLKTEALDAANDEPEAFEKLTESLSRYDAIREKILLLRERCCTKLREDALSITLSDLDNGKLLLLENMLFQLGFDTLDVNAELAQRLNPQAK